MLQTVTAMLCLVGSIVPVLLYIINAEILYFI